MSSKMPFTNYKIVKERMSEINKGFWKVQSIHKLSTKLSHKFNTKDFIIMKTIQRTPKYIPPFISFSNETRKFNINKNRSIKIKNNYSKGRTNIFITNERQKHINDIKTKNKKELKKKLFLNLYKNFPYEPYLYNELQFIYLQGHNSLIPRKFNEVVKDCFIMDKYNKILLNNKYNNSKYKTNNNKDLSKYTLFSNKSNNNNSEDKYLKSISVDRTINISKRKMNKKCKTENGEFEVNKNYLGSVYEKINKNKRSRKYNYFPYLGDKHLTEGDTYS